MQNGLERKNSIKSNTSSVISSEHENTRNVLVILLGWTGASPRVLSKYNNIYDNYEDYIAKKNQINQKDIETSDKVHIIVKQYIAPIHMQFFNMCLLQKWCAPIIKAIQSHRESFGDSSHVIIHTFSSGGSLILSAMNERIQRELRHNDGSLYYDGIIYDSAHLGPLSVWTALRVAWTIIKIELLSQCICYDTSSANENNLCGCLFIWCKLWYFLNYCIILLLSIIILPIIGILSVLYILITCSAEYIWCHDKKLLCADNIQILGVPLLLLGSDTDKINPIKKSIQFVIEKRKKIQLYRDMATQNPKRDNVVYDASEPTEDTVLLSVGSGVRFNINGYNTQFVKESNRYFVFKKSEHVEHYKTYPKEYQRQVTQFLDLCLQIDGNQ